MVGAGGLGCELLKNLVILCCVLCVSVYMAYTVVLIWATPSFVWEYSTYTQVTPNAISEGGKQSFKEHQKENTYVVPPLGSCARPNTVYWSVHLRIIPAASKEATEMRFRVACVL